MVRRAPARSRLSLLGDLPISRNARLLASRGRAASRARPPRSDARTRLAPAPPRRLQADRRADERARSPERDPLLRALPRAGQGFLLEGVVRTREGPRESEHREGHRQPARHRAGRLSARREDFRDAHAPEGGRRRRRAGARDHRQPDVPGHRPPDLQRLHEGVHLPEAGAGQHSADRDRRADRRAADAVGRRDLRPAHALESAERPPAVRPAVQRQERPRRRARPGRVHARPLPRERRLRRRRHRRPEDRAAAGGPRRHRCAGAAADSRLERDLPRPRRPRAGRVRRRVGIRHHGALGQELPDAAAPDARAAQGPADVRRRSGSAARCRSRTRGSTASTTSRSRPAPDGRRSST